MHPRYAIPLSKSLYVCILAIPFANVAHLHHYANLQHEVATAPSSSNRRSTHLADSMSDNFQTGIACIFMHLVSRGARDNEQSADAEAISISHLKQTQGTCPGNGSLKQSSRNCALREKIHGMAFANRLYHEPIHR